LDQRQVKGRGDGEVPLAREILSRGIPRFPFWRGKLSAKLIIALALEAPVAVILAKATEGQYVPVGWNTVASAAFGVWVFLLAIWLLPPLEIHDGKTRFARFLKAAVAVAGGVIAIAGLILAYMALG
jgi:hypothetical protein